MKKQLAIVTVAIMLMSVLVVPPVMAFALRDGKSLQYSYRGFNSITDNSGQRPHIASAPVTTSNQPIVPGNGIRARESISRVNYYRAPAQGKCISRVSADAVWNNSSASMNENPATNLDESEGKLPPSKIIKGTPEHPEQVLVYFEHDGRVHQVIVTIIMKDDPRHPSYGFDGY